MEEKIIPSEDIKRICKNILEFFSDYCRKNGLTFFLVMERHWGQSDIEGLFHGMMI